MCRIKLPPQSVDRNYKLEPVRLLKRLGSLKWARRKTAFLINKVVNHQHLIFSSEKHTVTVATFE